MNFQYHYNFPLDVEALESISGTLGFASSIGSFLSLVVYALSAMSLYTIARRRGLKNPWLAWIPIGFEWLLGSVSDQYQYLVKERNTSRRKLLLCLSLLNMVAGLVLLVITIVTIARLVISAHLMTEAEIAGMVLGPAMTVMIVGLVLFVLSVVLIVVRCMSIYDLYRSCQPDTAVIFLVIGILIYGAESIFLMIVRNKDEGMPPRKPEPVYQPFDPVYETPESKYQQPQEPWEAEE